MSPTLELEPLTALVNGRIVSVRRLTPLGMAARALCVALVLALLVAAAATLLVPSPAFASIINDAVKSLAEALQGACQSLINSALEFLMGVNKDSLTANSFENLLGSGDFSLYQMVQQIADNTVKPVAATILGLVALAQLIKISQHVDANATFPALKEVMVLFFFVAITMYLVNHGLEIVGGVYEIFAGFVRSIAGGSAVGNLTITFDFLSGESVDLLNAFGTLLGIMVSCAVVYLVAAVAAIVSSLMMVARAIQIYLYAAFAPLMFSIIGYDGTKPWAMGYLKGFMAACLSGFIIYFSVAAFPYMLASLMQINGVDMTAGGISISVTQGDSSNWFLGLVAGSLALILLQLKSGTFAREILGG